MRDYRGVSYDRIEDPKVREAVATVDEFLRQLSFGVGNLNVGKRADGSGRPVTPSALDDYFYLPGRNGGQLGHGGNAASNSLTLASTRHTTKGKVYFGTAQQSAYDELNNRLGSGTPSPETKLHVLGNPQPSLTAYTLSVNRSIAAEWYGIPSDPATYTYLIDANDSTQVYHEDVAIQSSAIQFGVTPTVAAAASYTVTYNAYRTGGGGTGTYTFTIIDSSGVAYLSAALNLADLNTGAPLLQTPVVVSALGGSGTANSIKITITKTNTVGEQFRFSELSFTGAGAGAGSEPALTLFERSAATSLPYSIWRDESDVTVASVSSTGAGQFQNVLLEDPGAGTGAISLIAPTGVTSYSLTFPANDGDNLDLLQTNGAGTLSWVTFASLLDDDLEAIGALTRTRGDLIVGGASAWVDLAIGTAAQLLQVNSGATDPAWVSMSADATLAAGGALTLATVNANVGTFGSATQVGQFTVNAKGLVTAAANVTITGVAPAAHTHPFTDITPIATDRLLGRDAAGSGVAEELSVSGGLEFTGSGGLQTSALTGDAAKAAGGTSLTLATVNSNVGTFGSATQSAQVTVNAKGLVTAAASVAITYPGGMSGFAISAADVDIDPQTEGIATTALRSDAKLQLSQAIAPTWTGLHSFIPSADVAAIVARGTNQSVGSLTANLFTGQNAAGLALFQVRNTGRLVLGANDVSVTGVVKLDIQAPAGQSVNMAQAVLNAATVWSLGSTGKMVTTTLAPQFNFTGATAATILTSTDTAGNTAWRTLVSGDIPALSYVASVTGTANRITSSGGLTPTIDISSAYVGQTSITTLGTIATGTWSATAIGLTKGGTGQTTAVAGFDALATVTSTSFGRSFLDRADAAAGRTLLELGSFATISSLAHSSLTGIGTDDHHALVHSHLNAGAGGQLSGAVVATPGIDFATFKAIAMACDSGSSVPPTPANGQWFRHIVAGRDILLQYDSTGTGDWKSIVAFTATTFYVNEASGTDDAGLGYGGTTLAFETLAYAVSRVAAINFGNVVINLAAGNYAGTTISGKSFTGAFSLTINGYAVTGSSTTITGGTNGTTTTQTLLTGSGAPFNTAVAGSIIKFTSGGNNGRTRVVNGNTGTVITLCGDALPSPPANLDTFEIYPLSSIITSTLSLRAGQATVDLNDLKISVTSSNAVVTNASVCNHYRCYFSSTAGYAYVNSFAKRHILTDCAVVSNTAGAGGIVLEGGDLTLIGSLVLKVAGNYGINAGFCNLLIHGGSAIDGFYFGLFGRAALCVFLPFTSHVFINNCTYGIVPSNSLVDGVESFVVFTNTYLSLQGWRRVLGQTATLGSTPILLVAAANQYVVSIYASVGSAMGATVKFILKWNDGSAKQTDFDLLPGATEDASLSCSIYVASGDVTIETVGAPGGGNYNLYCRIIGL